ncbi:MAG: thiamine pyrophosphate-binding protein [Bryobacteraceae bacterium]
MMNLSDYVIQFLVQKGVEDTFLVAGGGIMYLVDSVGREPGMRYYCNYHEQACGIAAEAYARVREHVGVCLATVGPGATNALSGILGAWVDSIPVILLCGQGRRNLMADFAKLRQLGPQEADVVGMAKPVTKYASSVRDPNLVRHELERAWYEATSGRPGPVMLEFPLDIQGAQIDETSLEGFNSPGTKTVDAATLRAAVQEVLRMIREAKRPVMICGNGVRLARSQPLLRTLLERAEIPVLLPITAKDVIEEDHPMNMGVFGTAGQRRANFTVQNSDLLLSLGAGLNCQKLGFNFAGFAPKAKKVIVEIDEKQLYNQVIQADLPIQCDVREFLEEMLRHLEPSTYRSPEKWLAACDRWKQRYPVMVPEFYEDNGYVNSYAFVDKLSDLALASDVVVTGNSLDCASYYQAYRIKRGQRAFDSGWGSTGWDLPTAIGACVGAGRARTICVTGDGSLQANIQELLALKRYRFPVKLFVMNNAGYQSVRSTQNSFFEGRFVGADYNSGVDNPHFDRLAAAYDLSYSRIENNAQLEQGIRLALSSEGPALCELNISPAQGISPKASAFRRADGSFESRPLEDMAPFLPREEVWENMHQFDND